ncbi:hypothetical protein K8I85_05640 [bacterium]|nr:hypothetical protein [bacterium]
MSSKENPNRSFPVVLSWIGLALLVATGGCMLADGQASRALGPDGTLAPAFELRCYPDTVTAPGGTTAVVPIVLSFVDFGGDSVVVRSGGGHDGDSHDGHSHDGGSHDGHSHDGSSSDDSSSDDSSSDDSSSDDDGGSGVSPCARVCYCDITDLDPMEAFLLDVEFDQPYLTFNSVQPSGTTASWVYFEGALLEPGVVRIGGFTTPPAAISNPDTLGYIVFDVDPDATGYSFLVATDFEDELAGLPNSVGCIRH